MIKILLLLSLIPAVSFAQIVTDTTINISDLSKRRPLKQQVSLNLYSQLYVHQSGIGSGIVGCERDYRKKIGWGFGLRPEYILNGNIFSIHFEYINRILHYYSWPVVPPDPYDTSYHNDQAKDYNKESINNFCFGTGYGYQINVNDLLKINLEVHLSDRVIIQLHHENEFFLVPYLSLNIKSFGIFYKENINLSRELYSSENFSGVIGVNYRAKLFDKKGFSSLAF